MTRDERLILGEQLVASDNRSVQLGQYAVRVGGEVRAELDVFVSVRPSLTAEVTGIAKLFEGATTSTDDLDDSRTFSFEVASAEGPA